MPPPDKVESRLIGVGRPAAARPFCPISVGPVKNDIRSFFPSVTICSAWGDDNLEVLLRFLHPVQPSVELRGADVEACLFERDLV